MRKNDSSDSESIAERPRVDVPGYATSSSALYGRQFDVSTRRSSVGPDPVLLPFAPSRVVVGLYRTVFIADLDVQYHVGRRSLSTPSSASCPRAHREKIPTWKCVAREFLSCEARSGNGCDVGTSVRHSSGTAAMRKPANADARSTNTPPPSSGCSSMYAHSPCTTRTSAMTRRRGAARTSSTSTAPRAPNACSAALAPDLREASECRRLKALTERHEPEHVRHFALHAKIALISARVVEGDLPRAHRRRRSEEHLL